MDLQLLTLMVLRSALEASLQVTGSQTFDGEKGLRVRNSPTCTLSQNGYGDNRFDVDDLCDILQTSSVTESHIPILISRESKQQQGKQKLTAP